MEIWKDIKGYEGLYQVSNEGNVVRLWKKSKKLISQETSRGYKRVHLYKNGISQHHSVHRLVATAFVENPDNLPQVNHKDENPGNNKVENLEWCDAKYNRNYGTCNERIRKAQLGRKFTEEHKKNLSESLKNSERFHKVVKSAEYREKLSKIRKGKQLNRKDLSVQVDQISMVDGEVINSYPSAKEAARQTGFAQANISRCCNGGFYYRGKWINVSQAYGFIWRKLDLNQPKSEQL